VNPGWVAGGVRARLLLGHRVGPELAPELARSGSLEDALGLLAGTPYARHVPPGLSLEDAQRAVAASVALSCRVLAAWLPRDAAVEIRAMASWFELANIEDRIAYLVGGRLRPPFELGVLSSVWEAAAAAGSLDDMRRILARSAWGDPGSDQPEDIQRWLRISWARRVTRQAPVAYAWSAGALAILVAAEMFVAARVFDPQVARRLGLGAAWQDATSVPDLRERLPAQAAWALTGVEEPSELWRAELGWWNRVGRDAESMLRTRLDDRGVVVAAVALLAIDATRVNAALAAAARSGSAPALEVVDALC
jgi:hypothetical protein